MGLGAVGGLELNLSKTVKSVDRNGDFRQGVRRSVNSYVGPTGPAIPAINSLKGANLSNSNQLPATQPPSPSVGTRGVMSPRRRMSPRPSFGTLNVPQSDDNHATVTVDNPLPLQREVKVELTDQGIPKLPKFSRMTDNVNRDLHKKYQEAHIQALAEQAKREAHIQALAEQAKREAKSRCIVM